MFEIKGNYFDGEFHSVPTTGPKATEMYISRKCPANLEQTLWNAPIDYSHVENVIASSKEGYKTWKKISLEEKIKLFKAYKEEVLLKQEEIAIAIALETGKPLWEAKTESSAVAAKVDVTINDSLPRINRKFLESIAPNTNGHIKYKSIGPSLIIGPFNFPCHLANGQILSALIAGNSIIFKPSEKTFYSAQLLIECFHKAGFPKGVINLILGDGEAARRILNEKEIKGVFFTGSKDIGKKILSQCSSDLSKLVSLELGGKNTTIIEADSMNDYSLSELIKSCFWTTGQRCTSTAFVAVHRSISSELIEKFHSLTKKLIIDHPIEHEKVPFMGPLVDQNSVDTYLSYMSMAKREGVEEIMRGKQLEKRFKGHYVSPSIHLASGLNPNGHFLQGEIFGPNVTFFEYDSLEEAIEIANSTEYGLATSVFSKDDSVFEKCLDEIEVGILNHNRSTVGASSKLPFGGVKNSGNYRPAAVSTVDYCVYQTASLTTESDQNVEINSIVGIDA